MQICHLQALRYAWLECTPQRSIRDKEYRVWFAPDNLENHKHDGLQSDPKKDQAGGMCLIWQQQLDQWHYIQPKSESRPPDWNEWIQA
jgi:hypothetical protein